MNNNFNFLIGMYDPATDFIIVNTGKNSVLVIRCKEYNSKVIFLHHSASKNSGFDLFPFSVSNPEADGWIFMLIAHGNAPFVLAVVAGGIDNLTATGIYSL